jgi:hypothetical protein
MTIQELYQARCKAKRLKYGTPLPKRGFTKPLISRSLIKSLTRECVNHPR